VIPCNCGGNQLYSLCAVAGCMLEITKTNVRPVELGGCQHIRHNQSTNQPGLTQRAATGAGLSPPSYSSILQRNSQTSSYISDPIIWPPGSGENRAADASVLERNCISSTRGLLRSSVLGQSLRPQEGRRVGIMRTEELSNNHIVTENQMEAHRYIFDQHTNSPSQR
jgi:hypothetical protein